LALQIATNFVEISRIVLDQLTARTLPIAHNMLDHSTSPRLQLALVGRGEMS